MEAHGQLHAPATLPQEKEPLVPITHNITMGWYPMKLYTFLKALGVKNVKKHCSSFIEYTCVCFFIEIILTQCISTTSMNQFN
jgi:hypothetical protein